MSDLISREAAIGAALYACSRDVAEYVEEAIRALPPAQEAAPALAQESADMPYRIFTDTSRVWLDDDDGGSLFAYVREGAAPAAKVKQADLRAAVKHAFIAGRTSAGGSSSFIDGAWSEYDPTESGGYARILAALEGGEA